jgi:putative FmdB family regulatory protein
LPLYSFECDKCQKEYEALIKLKDFDEPVKCPHCGKKLKRIMKPVMFKV